MRIIIAYDGSACSEAAIEDMRRAGLPHNAEALVVCVVDDDYSLVPDSDLSDCAFRDSARRRLEAARSLAEMAQNRIKSQFPGWKVYSEVLWGPPARIILERTYSWSSDLVIVGSHGRSLAERIFPGSVSLKLARKAPCSVRVVRAGGGLADGPIRVMVANDGSAEAEEVVREVSRRSWPNKTEARVVSVVEAPQTMVSAIEAGAYGSEFAFLLKPLSDEQQVRTRLRDIEEESVERLQRAGLMATSAVTVGDPMHSLVAEAERWSVDAIFMGAREPHRLEQLLLGSVSTAVLTHAHCAVEIVRQRAGLKVPTKNVASLVGETEKSCA